MMNGMRNAHNHSLTLFSTHAISLKLEYYFVNLIPITLVFLSSLPLFLTRRVVAISFGGFWREILKMSLKREKLGKSKEATLGFRVFD
ncbi:transmembrane protein, putative [Medicago truncatula]|uniref:Transmembrane protein, putative n=1 Tax=Medicago truncatula TaxID=3880 RepID=A0A072V1X1_MEDTR|nr:transmembrane protein, putative [Medicago truncatula]